MCEPATIAYMTLALAAASSAAQVSAQKQQVKAQDTANQQQYDNTMTAYRQNLANIEATRGQLAQDASEKINENNKAGRAAAATATVAGGEAGVAGLSVDALLRDLRGEAAYDNTNVEANYLRSNASLNAQRENVNNTTTSDINSLRSAPMPDYLGAGLRIGQAGLGAYAGYQQQQAILKGQKGVS